MQYCLLYLFMVSEPRLVDALTPSALFDASYIESGEFSQIIDVIYDNGGNNIAVLCVNDDTYRIALYGGSGFGSTVFDLDGMASCFCDYISNQDDDALAVVESRADSVFLCIYAPVPDDLWEWNCVEKYLISLPRAPSTIHQIDSGEFIIVCGFIDTDRMVAGWDVRLLSIQACQDSLQAPIQDMEVTPFLDTPDQSGSHETIYWNEERSYGSIEELYSILIEPPRIAVLRNTESSRLYIAPASRDEYLIHCFDLQTREESFRYYSRLDELGNMQVWHDETEITALTVSTMSKDSLEIAYERTQAMSITEQLSDWQPQPLRRMIRSLAVSSDGNLWVERGACEHPTLDRFEEDGRFVGSYVLESCDRLERYSQAPVPWSPAPWQIAFTVDNQLNIVAFSLRKPPNNIYMLRVSDE